MIVLTAMWLTYLLSYIWINSVFLALKIDLMLKKVISTAGMKQAQDTSILYHKLI